MASEPLTNPNSNVSDGYPADNGTLSCSAALPTWKSLYIDIGWTFTGGAPAGEYTLTLDNGQLFFGPIDNGRIRLDNALDSLEGKGSLSIEVTDGPTYKADIELDLPEIQTREGLARRLTNLGLYAGTDGIFDGRARWAVRAFKRITMNRFTRNGTVPENDNANVTFLQAVQRTYGAHPEDVISSDLPLGPVSRAFIRCNMFGSRTYRRSSFETKNAPDDKDPLGAGNGAIWAGATASGVEERVAGTFTLFLRAFDPAAGEPPIPNRVNLPQPIHMAQFVLFELGYWLIRGTGGWRTVNGTQTRVSYTPDGSFSRLTHWAMREFQCHAKFANAAQEDSSSTETRYLPRLFRNSPVPVSGPARYPATGTVSGALNALTRDALQAWADDALRCPVIVYASTDNNNPVANGSDLSLLVKENLWLYNDHANTAPQMYAIDYSRYYPLPTVYNGNISSGGSTFPRPILLGEYTTSRYGNGPRSIPSRHSWESEYVEVRPDTMIGAGGLDGVGLTAAQLSTFKAVRTAAHFECYGYTDCFNAYDDVTISVGPCQWTLARCSGTGSANERRELPAFLAFMRNHYAADYQTLFEFFGMLPERAWPIPLSSSTGTYADRLTLQTETGTCILCGKSGDNAFKYQENHYGKSWHVFYRFQMACRTSLPIRQAMWDFTRTRIQDILDKTFTISGATVRVGDHVTSEKGVAMLLRWHIFRPGHLFRTPTPSNPNYLQNILTSVIAAHPTANQARENAILANLSATGGPRTNGGLTEIYGWTNVPQQGLRAYYHLNLSAPTLSTALNSFQFAPP